MKKILKFLLISTFFSYYFVAIALNFPWINRHLNILELLGEKKLVHVQKKVYMGGYPDGNYLKKIKKEYGINQIIVLLDPNFPISEGLVKEEKKICAQLNIELLIVPIPYFSTNISDYIIINNLLQGSNKISYIHAYYFDTRMRLLKNILK